MPSIGGLPIRWGEIMAMDSKQSVDGIGSSEGEQPLADREVDIELLAFVERYVNSPVKWDIITFFGGNPYTRDTAVSIASRVGRDMSVVLPELGDLVMLEVLEQTKLDGKTVYHLTQEASLRQMAFRFVQHFGSARFRRAGQLSGPSSSALPPN